MFFPGESQSQEPGGLPSMGSHRVGHDWCDLAAAADNTSEYSLILEYIPSYPQAQSACQLYPAGYRIVATIFFLALN